MWQERYEELARALCIEAGKPIKDSRGEVGRLIDTFMIAMEECTRNYGAIAGHFMLCRVLSSPQQQPPVCGCWHDAIRCASMWDEPAYLGNTDSDIRFHGMSESLVHNHSGN